MTIHFEQHHAGYVNNLNRELTGLRELEGGGLEDLMARISRLPEGIQTALRNNRGGHYNHTLFWDIMSPRGGGEPAGGLYRRMVERGRLVTGRSAPACGLTLSGSRLRNN